jgi:hypothetical protein
MDKNVSLIVVVAVLALLGVVLGGLGMWKAHTNKPRPASTPAPNASTPAPKGTGGVMFRAGFAPTAVSGEAKLKLNLLGLPAPDIVPFDTVVYAINCPPSALNTTTGVFTVPAGAGGMYMVTFSLVVQGPSPGNCVGGIVVNDGVTINGNQQGDAYGGSQLNGINTWSPINCTTIVGLKAQDTVKIVLASPATGAVLEPPHSYLQLTWLQPLSA